PPGLGAGCDRGTTVVVLAGDCSWLESQPGSCATAGCCARHRTSVIVAASRYRLRRLLPLVELALLACCVTAPPGCSINRDGRSTGQGGRSPHSASGAPRRRSRSPAARAPRPPPAARPRSRSPAA